MKTLTQHINESFDSSINENKKTTVELLPGQKRFAVHFYDESRGGFQFWSSNAEKDKGFNDLESAKKYAISKLTKNEYFAHIIDNTIWSGSNPIWKNSGTVIMSISDKGKKITKF